MISSTSAPASSSRVSPLILVSAAMIEFRTDGGERGAAYARAATLTRFCLTCCVGYSGDECPVFWKRVFCPLTRLREDPEASDEVVFTVKYDKSISDAHRFFFEQDSVFPRVRLLDAEEEFCEAGFGERRGPVDGYITTKLQQIFEQLRPFMVVGRRQRVIPVPMKDANFMRKALRDRVVLDEAEPMFRREISNATLRKLS